jgi:hypothetical protein
VPTFGIEASGCASVLALKRKSLGQDLSIFCLRTPAVRASALFERLDERVIDTLTNKSGVSAPPRNDSTADSKNKLSESQILVTCAKPYPGNGLRSTTSIGRRSADAG